MSRSRVSSSPLGESDLLRSLVRRDEERQDHVQLLFQKEQQDKAEKKCWKRDTRKLSEA